MNHIFFDVKRNKKIFIRGIPHGICFLGDFIFKLYPKRYKYKELYHWILGLAYFIPICCIKEWIADQKNNKDAIYQRRKASSIKTHIKCSKCIRKEQAYANT